MRHFARVDSGLFDAVLNRCVDTDRLCMNEMMAIDAAGGLGLEGLKPLATPRRGDPAPGRVRVVGSVLGQRCRAAVPVWLDRGHEGALSAVVTPTCFLA